MGLKLVLIDDNEDYTYLLATLLRRRGVEVIDYISPDYMLLFDGWQDADAIVCDFKLASRRFLDGIDVLKFVAQTQPQMLRVLLTGVPSTSVPDASIAHIVLYKPVDADIIEDTVQQLQTGLDS